MRASMVMSFVQHLSQINPRRHSTAVQYIHETYFYLGLILCMYILHVIIYFVASAQM